MQSQAKNYMPSYKPTLKDNIKTYEEGLRQGHILIKNEQGFTTV